MAKKAKEVKSPQVYKLAQEYAEADRLLQSRIQNKRYGFDNYDRLYNSFLGDKWPYQVKLATPRGFTAIFNKTTRMIGGRFTGRIEGVGIEDAVGAKIATEHFKWSVERFNQYSDKPIEEKIAMWDTNARLYGAGFVRVYWKTEYKDGKKVYDNWYLEVINNRDLLLQPGRETIKDSDYVIHRRYVSGEELKKLQEDGANFDKKALDQILEKEGSGKEANYIPIIKSIKGVDTQDNRIEMCVTYYKDKWITWCPKMGDKGKKEALILREIKNPYLHQEIPIVPLIYIPSQEDIYGMSELQPVSALLKILSALQSQFVELVNRQLYPPTLVSANESRIDTFKYRSKAFWLVNNPAAVSVLDTKASQSLSSFSETYKMIVTEFLEAMGETGSSVSQADQFGGKKTATEINDKAFIRGSRDNFNKLLLSAALKRVMFLAFEMLRDPKFTEKDTVIKVVGPDALEYFDKQGFADWGINKAGYEIVYEYAQQLEQSPELKEAAKENGTAIFDLAYQDLIDSGALDAFAEPATPITTAKGLVSKMETTDEDNVGYLRVDPEQDYLGQYNFIADVEALAVPDPAKDYQARAGWYEQAKESEKSGVLQQQGYQLKHKEILVKLAELAKIKEAEQYFEKAEGGMYGPIQAGPGDVGAGIPGQGLPNQQAVQSDPVASINGAGQGVPGPQTAGMGRSI